MALTIGHKRVLEKSKFLYHGTNKEHLVSIMKEGLKPGNLTGINNYPHLSDSSAIYLTSSEADAFFYAKGKKRSDKILIQVDVSKLDQKLLDCDPLTELEDYFTYRKIIEPEALTVISNL